MSRPFDVIIWGTTGIVGNFATEYFLTHAPSTVKWAVAGRNEAKIRSSLSNLSSFGDVSKIPVLIASADHQHQIDELVKQTKVIMALVGPYAEHGEPIVDACVRFGTDYVDITGEISFVKRMIEKYHQKAIKNNVRIVHFCGFDCIPSDLGAYMIAHHFKEKYKENTKMIHFTDIGCMGTVSGGTVHSLVGQLNRPWSELKKLQNEFYLAETAGTPHPNGMTYFNTFTKKYEGYYFMSGINIPVVRRTNSLLSMAYGQDFVYSEGKQFPHYLLAFLFSGTLFSLIGILTFFSPARWLLKKLIPQGSGPSREMTFKGRLDVALHGESVSGKRARVEIKVKRDPGYGQTSIMVAESALCLALDSDKLAKEKIIPLEKSGVLTAASALGMPLIKRLQQSGMTFELKEIQ